MKYYAGIDIGTGGARCAIFDVNGKLVSLVRQEWLPTVNPKYPGAREFDTVVVWRLLCTSLRQSIHEADIDAHDIAAITAVSMREGMVLFDKNMKDLWATVQVDSRASEELKEMARLGIAQKIYDETGDWPTIQNPPRFWWLRKYLPEIYIRVAHMLMLCDWALYNLSGELASEPSIASSSGMFDLRRRTWSDEVIKAAQLPEGIYPPVYPSGTVIGRVTAKAASETGLIEGTPVVTGGSDSQIAMLGAGVIKPKSYAICGGTFWQTVLIDDHPWLFSESRLKTLCHAVTGLWMSEGSGLLHGFIMRWFRDSFCQEEVRQAREVNKDVYLLMEQLAQKVPAGSNGVLAIFSNLANMKHWVHAPASFVGFDIFSPDRTGKAACIRAIEENAAYTSKGHIEIISRETGRIPYSIRMMGGASKGILWPQIVSDALGVPLEIPKEADSTYLGAAICGMVATSECNNWHEAVERLIRIDRIIEPNLKEKAKYDDLFIQWLKVYERMLVISEEGLMPPMWRAAGV